MLGWKPPREKSIWALVVILLIGWGVLHWLWNRSKADETNAAAFRLELFSLLEAWEAAQDEDIPGWLRMLARANDLPDRIAQALEAADQAGLNDEGLQVDKVLACLALAETTGEKDRWQVEAVRRLAAVKDASQSAYHESVTNWANGGLTLRAEEKMAFEGLMAWWPADWAVNRLAARYGIVEEGALVLHRKQGVRQLWRSALFTVLAVLAVSSAIPCSVWFVRKLRAARHDRPKTHRWIGVVPPDLLLLGFALTEFALLAGNVGIHYVSLALVMQNPVSHEIYAQAWWLGMVLFACAWMAAPKLLAVLTGLGRVPVAKIAGWRWADLVRADVWRCAGAAACVLVVGMALFNYALDTAGITSERDFLDSLRFSTRGFSIAQWLAFMAWGAFLGPALEEVVFRGFLFQGIARAWGVRWGMVVSALLFSIGHAYGLAGTLAIAGYGLIFAWLYHRTGSLVLVALTHCLHNFLLEIWEALEGVW